MKKNTPWQNKNSWASAKSVPPLMLLIVTCSRRTTTQQFHRKNTGLEDLSAWKLGVHLRITTLRTAQNPVQNIHSTLSPVITLLVQKSVQRRLEKSAGFTVRACKFVHCIHIKGQFSEFQICATQSGKCTQTTHATHHESMQRMVLREKYRVPLRDPKKECKHLEAILQQLLVLLFLVSELPWGKCSPQGSPMVLDHCPKDIVVTTDSISRM